MRIIFAGTPPMAVPSLEKIARNPGVAAVLTAPDAPAGRNRTPYPSAVKQVAMALGIPVLTPAVLDETARETVRTLAPDLLVVVAYGKIFKKNFLDLFPRGGINVHPSVLPRHRGPSPITAAILAGDRETGVTVQKLAMRFDTGDILAQVRVPLDGTETTGSLTDSLSAVGAEQLSGVIADMEAGRPAAAAEQDESQASYCRLVRKEDGLISWAEPAAVIERKVRAYDPWPRTSTTLGGTSLLLLKSSVHPDTLPNAAHEPVPGDVVAANGEQGILVQTGQGILRIERLQLQFKKPMDWRSFLNGRPDLLGMRLGN
jgi:methionyl-tRNA formyltransferase